MVRVCAVEGCSSSDLTHLSHRFPKNLLRAKEWQDALELQDKDLETMLEKYTVCTLHFEKKDYRNIESRHLNKTALPKLVTSFWKPPKREKKSEITREVVDNDRNSPHVNIVNAKEQARRGAQIIAQSATIVEEMEEFDEDPTNRPIGLADKPEEYYIVVESESENTNDDQMPQKRKNTHQSRLKTKKPCPEPEAEEEPLDDEEVVQHEEAQYGFVDSIEMTEVVYRDNTAQTEEEDEKEVEEEIINSGYWENSKVDLIRILLERDQKCKELEKKIEDFRHAKEKMLQSIELMKMM
ncbi:uncharacterized protein LOC129794858 [Lutzomyia longipalpis]|uniref:uncharacterized protein LOC129794858 n=1 Tax=Lutzomyia longipalpis TaxID=7200 RepID=UPI002483B963|nr:uncharacterized protein LOC129794858 [Lutzomyia longipalpis]